MNHSTFQVMKKILISTTGGALLFLAFSGVSQGSVVNGELDLGEFDHFLTNVEKQIEGQYGFHLGEDLKGTLKKICSFKPVILPRDLEEIPLPHLLDAKSACKLMNSLAETGLVPHKELEQLQKFRKTYGHPTGPNSANLALKFTFKLHETPKSKAESEAKSENKGTPAEDPMESKYNPENEEKIDTKGKTPVIATNPPPLPIVFSLGPPDPEVLKLTLNALESLNLTTLPEKRKLQHTKHLASMEYELEKIKENPKHPEKQFLLHHAELIENLEDVKPKKSTYGNAVRDYAETTERDKRRQLYAPVSAEFLKSLEQYFENKKPPHLSPAEEILLDVSKKYKENVATYAGLTDKEAKAKYPELKDEYKELLRYYQNAFGIQKPPATPIVEEKKEEEVKPIEKPKEKEKKKQHPTAEELQKHIKNNRFKPSEIAKNKNSTKKMEECINSAFNLNKNLLKSPSSCSTESEPKNKYSYLKGSIITQEIIDVKDGKHYYVLLKDGEKDKFLLDDKEKEVRFTEKELSEAGYKTVVDEKNLDAPREWHGGIRYWFKEKN